MGWGLGIGGLKAAVAEVAVAAMTKRGRFAKWNEIQTAAMVKCGSLSYQGVIIESNST